MGLKFDESVVPKVNEETCVGCGLCVETCPDHVLVLKDDRPRATEGEFLGCIACGHCMMVCPTGSIGIAGRGMTVDDGVQLPPPQQRATAEGLEALLTWRRSVRKFKEQPVERELLDRVVAMTSTAPMGIPPHEVGMVVFHGREKVRAFVDDACASFGRMARFFNPVVLTVMRPFVGKTQHRVMRDFVKPLLEALVRMREAGTDALAYDAPAAMLMHHTPWADPADCHVAATYAMLAAESLGLGTCMIGTTVALTHDKAVKAKYGIAAEDKVGLMVVMGYPAVKFQRGVRRRLASVRFA